MTVNTHKPSTWGSRARVAIALLAVFVLAACGGQVPQAAQPLATAAEQVQATALPVTGLASPTAVPAAAEPTLVQPDTSQPAQPTQAGTAQPAQADAASAAPQCASPATPSPALTEGPYFKANSPERTSLLEPGMTGTKLTLTGLRPDDGLQTGGERAGRLLAGGRRGAV